MREADGGGLAGNGIAGSGLIFLGGVAGGASPSNPGFRVGKHLAGTGRTGADGLLRLVTASRGVGGKEAVGCAPSSAMSVRGKAAGCGFVVQSNSPSYMNPSRMKRSLNSLL